jgi:hypothetical protein
LDYYIVELACDGKEALQPISKEYKVTKSGSNSYDIIAAAKKHLATLPIQRKFRHVRGNQKTPKA